MSRLTTWQRCGTGAMAYMQKYLSGQLPWAAETRVPLPIESARWAEQELESWQRFCMEESTLLHEERRNFCKEFIFGVSLASRLVHDHSPSDPLVYLGNPLALLLQGMQQLLAIQDFDNLYPEQGSGAAWLDIKMGLTQVCLRLLLGILRAIGPSFADTWGEWEVSLHVCDWKQQFIIDSPTSEEKLMIPPSEFPRLCQKFREARNGRSGAEDGGESSEAEDEAGGPER